jgi:hypothetical protein
MALPTHPAIIRQFRSAVQGAELTAGNAGAYQIAIQYPPNVSNGDLLIVAQVVGVSFPYNIDLTVRR